jgi:SAM-dependent methyltransferase
VTDKERVRDFWEHAPCGEAYARGDALPERLEAQARARYELEPYLPAFARFGDGRGRDVLELGVGMGADHLEWARSRPRSLTGIDLTPSAVAYTSQRLRLFGLASRLLVADVERLPLPHEAFDLVYSWGVIHHSPDTPAAALEIRRVLRPGGQARVMIYHRHSLVGYMLWLRYGLLVGCPRLGLSETYARYLESPGTKAYSLEEARRLFGGFSEVRVRTLLSPGDLLQGAVGHRHRSIVLTAAKALYPRWIVRRLLAHHGLYLLIEATK